MPAKGGATDQPVRELWTVDLDAGAAPLNALDVTWQLTPHDRTTSPPEGAAARERADRRKIAHVALRLLLVRHAGLELARRPFAVGAAGKPALAPDGERSSRAIPHFSLAHAERFALIGITLSGPIGVDIEVQRTVRIREDRRALLETVAAALAPGTPLPHSPRDDRFLQAWVRLEAAAKATGEGISALLARLGARHVPTAEATPSPTQNAPELSVADVGLDLPKPTFAAVAVAGPPRASPAPVVTATPLDLAPGSLRARVEPGRK